MPKNTRCLGCKHPISFHGHALTDCAALGCKCEAYVGTTKLALTTISAADAAAILGRTERWVKEHAKELHGISVRQSELERPAKKADPMVWRFDAEDIQEARLSMKIPVK